MRISVTKPHTDNATVYVIKDVYLKDVRGKKCPSSNSKDRTTKTVKCLGKVMILSALIISILMILLFFGLKKLLNL